MEDHDHNKAADHDKVRASRVQRGGGYLPRERYNSPSPSRFIWPLVFGLIVFCALYLVPLPLYTYKPGTAENVGPMVHLQHEKQGQGSFLLTTIGLSDTNLIGYIYAKLNSDLYELRPKTEVRREGETESEYSQRQVYNMRASQSNAIQVAYERAQIPYHIDNIGTLILRVSQDMPAYGKLQVGDIIHEIDGHPANQASEMMDYLNGKKEGDQVQVVMERGGTSRTETIAVAALPPQEGDTGPRVGLGVSIANMQEVKAEDEANQVNVQAGQIGGPSAGLMFALEIYNRLVEEDITKGYTIAGTGEIDTEGNVGVIGGIKFKVVAADREGADIFFAPKDLYPEENQHFNPILNASIAEEQARNINSDMTVVPVGTIEEALEYLDNLPPKVS